MAADEAFALWLRCLSHEPSHTLYAVGLTLVAEISPMNLDIGLRKYYEQPEGYSSKGTPRKNAFTCTPKCTRPSTVTIRQPEDSASNCKLVCTIINAVVDSDYPNSNLILKQDPTNCGTRKVPSPLVNSVHSLRIASSVVRIILLLSFRAMMGRLARHRSELFLQ